MQQCSLIKKQAVEVFCLACFKFMMAPLERFVHRSISSKSVKVNLPNLNNNNNQIKKKELYMSGHCSPQRTFLFPRSSFNAHFRIRSFLKGNRQKKSIGQRKPTSTQLQQMGNPHSNFFLFPRRQIYIQTKGGCKKLMCKNFSPFTYENFKSNNTDLFQ